MAHYLMKFKGQYRILPELDKETNDFPRNAKGEIDESYDDIYIACQYGNRIYSYGKEGNRIVLMAYIPSLIRGHNLIKEMQKQGIPYTHYLETDEEVTFHFKPAYIDAVANLMKARTYGASISPFSTKNLPKSNVEIPKDYMDAYKAVVADVSQSDLLVFSRMTEEFLTKRLQKKFKTDNKYFNVFTDMKQMKLARQRKEYIYVKGMWDDYLAYLSRRIKQLNKQKQENEVSV